MRHIIRQFPRGGALFILIGLLMYSAGAPAWRAPAVHAGGFSPPPGTWARTGSLHHARAFAAATLLPSGQVLVAGGCQAPCGHDPEPSLASAELYNPRTGAWTVTGAMRHPRLQYTATLLPSGHVLVVGGCATADCSTILASAELYNPRTGAWTPTGSLHDARALQSATLLPDGQVLLTGGCGDPGCAITLASAELYNPVSGAWTTTGSLHDPRARHRTALLPNGQVLVAGGCIPANCSTVLDSAELYHPRTGAWTTTGSLQTARCCVGLMLLHTGQALAIGGHDQTGASTSAELYNPVRGAWTATGSLSDAREYEVPETATLLPSGQVLVAGDGGGNNNGATPLASAELYHPRRGVWTATGALHDPRSFQTTTLLSNGQVLVAGGINATGILATAELYQP
jgi:N-acetylneuraminic acid mutarotase